MASEETKEERWKRLALDALRRSGVAVTLADDCPMGNWPGEGIVVPLIDGDDMVNVFFRRKGQVPRSMDWYWEFELAERRGSHAEFRDDNLRRILGQISRDEDDGHGE